MQGKLVSENRRARFDYDVQETFVAGVELLGHEVKSVKAGHAGLQGSYVLVRGGEAWLLNCSVPPYQSHNVPTDYNPSRTRRVLLHKEELKKLAGKLEEKGTAFVPLAFVLERGLVKIILGLGRARKAHDKRELLKKRAAEREMRGAR